MFCVDKCDCFYGRVFDPNSGITLSCHRRWTRSRRPCRTIGRPSPISTRLLRPITRRAALPRWRSEWKSVGTVFLHKNAHKPKNATWRREQQWSTCSCQRSCPTSQRTAWWYLISLLSDVCEWGVLFHSFHSCLEETNTIISSKSGLEPKQVLLLTALPTNLIVGLRFTAHPGIHRVLYLPGWWSSDFVDEMLGVVRFYHEFPRWYPLPEIRQLAAVNLLASWGVYVRSDQNPDRKLLYIHEAIWELQWTIEIQ